MATATEWKRYLDNVIGTSDSSFQNPFEDTANLNPTEEIYETLPFRFTQYQLNPQREASSGQSERTPVGRSPFTSGALAQELKGLEGQLNEMGDVSDPGEMPVAPEYPEPTEDTSSSVQTDMSAGAPMAFGIPTRSYEVPTGLLSNFKGNPLDLALQYEFGKIPKQEGPTTSITGYDVPGMIGEEQWNSILGAKNRQRGSEQRALYNLAILPTTFDPKLSRTSNLQNLANIDFSDLGRYTLTNNPEWSPEAREAGYDGPQFSPTGEAFSDEMARQHLYTNREDTGLNKFMSSALPTGLLAALAALTGGAAGAAVGAAGGLGGAVGLSGGGATALNMGAGIGASLLSNAGLSAAGVDMNHPVARIAGAGIGGAIGGALSGSGVQGNNYGSQTAAELRPTGIYDYLERNNLSPGDLMDMMGEEQFVASFGDPNKFTQGFDTYSGIASTIPNNTGNLEQQGRGRFATGVLEAGAQGYEATQPSEAGGLNSGMYTEAELNAYNQAYEEYQSEIDKYFQELERYNEYQQLWDEYNQKMNKYQDQSSAFSNRQIALSRSQGLQNQIASNIATNPFYDPKENYAGIQQTFIS